MSLSFEQIRDEALKLPDAKRRALADELNATLDTPGIEDDDPSLDELLTPDPLTGEEIAAQGLLGGWEDLNIEDSGEWVKEQRRIVRSNRIERHS